MLKRLAPHEKPTVFCSMNQESAGLQHQLTPSRIVQELDKYIIGQQEAKKAVAVALRNRWRRLQVSPDLRADIVPNNILMIGTTGVGKTEIARRLARLAEAPFIKVEASKFTEVGYVGRDVESMVRDLVEQSVNLVKSRHKENCINKARESALQQVLDLLIPPLHRSGEPSPAHIDYVGTDASRFSDHELNERTREKFKQKLLNGELRDRMVEIEVTAPASPVGMLAPVGLEGLDGIQELISQMTPKKRKKRRVSVAEAIEQLTEEEAQRLIDMDVVVREALEKAQQSGIIFIDEIDKIASGANGRGGADVSREGVQRDLLPIIEGTVVNTKYGAVSTDHVLFIAAGAFHLSKPSDLIPELQGRLPIRVELGPLTEDDFYQILKQPQNALTRQYAALLASEGVKLEFEDEALRELARLAFQVNQEVENIGARRLHTLMSTLLESILFEVPDLTDIRHYTITAQQVRDRVGHIVKSRDLSHFIL